jgi:hypothetical protein
MVTLRNSPAPGNSKKLQDVKRRKISAADWVAEVERRGAERRANYRKPGPKRGTPRRRPARWDPLNDKPAALYVPIKLDPASIPAAIRWCVLYVLSLIHFKAATWRADAHGYVRLKQRYLIRVVPQRVLREVWRWLEQRGIVECDNRTAAGKKCTGYRLTEAYKQTHRVVCLDPALNTKIKARAERDLLPVHRELRACLDAVRFDLDRALAIIATMKPRRRRRKRPLTVRQYRRELTDQVTRLANGDHFLEADKYGRVHTPLTILPRALRCCLTLDGEPLVYLDAACCQPLLLALKCVLWLRASPSQKRTLLAKKFAEVDPYRATWQVTSRQVTVSQAAGVGVTKAYYQQHRCGTSSKLRDLRRSGDRNPSQVGNYATDLPPDLAAFLAACLDGSFYTWLMTPEERARGKEFRARLKRRFFVVMFKPTKGKSRFRNRLHDRFRKVCPTAAAVLDALKEKNYRHSAHVLQNFEATLFIYRVCGRIMKERPGVRLVTVHDCIGTTAEHIPFVKRVILEEFAALFGVVPTLKEETYP